MLLMFAGGAIFGLCVALFVAPPRGLSEIAIFISQAWLLVVEAVVFGTLGIWRAFRGYYAWRTWRRARAGLCANCGYDLRASKERCPECGVEIAADEMRGAQ